MRGRTSRTRPTDRVSTRGAEFINNARVERKCPQTPGVPTLSTPSRGAVSWTAPRPTLRRLTLEPSDTSNGSAFATGSCSFHNFLRISRVFITFTTTYYAAARMFPEFSVLSGFFKWFTDLHPRLGGGLIYLSIVF